MFAFSVEVEAIPTCPQLRWQLTKDEVTVVPPASCAMQIVPFIYSLKDSDLSNNHDLPMRKVANEVGN